ncbi:hypothetical protein Ga0061065_101107 [Marinomonas fungiae]|uniref:Uncharacterized protein n=1 Tax=Marinomonas fungiae TaxID=1137284 RepID=A0A0K6IGL4_9GAMM|nr:hypothetical protein Ga0061065_101107 [Marinomonas fungiae]
MGMGLKLRIPTVILEANTLYEGNLSPILTSITGKWLISIGALNLGLRHPPMQFNWLAHVSVRASPPTRQRQLNAWDSANKCAEIIRAPCYVYLLAVKVIQ